MWHFQPLHLRDTKSYTIVDFKASCPATFLDGGDLARSMLARLNMYVPMGLCTTCLHPHGTELAS